MKKIMLVAVREFMATVSTKAFIFGVLFTPLLLLALAVLLPRLMDDAPPKVAGEIAVIDPTGLVGGAVASHLAPEALAARREDQRRRIAAAAEQAAPVGKEVARQAAESALGEVPRLRVAVLDPGTDIESAKAPLIAEADAKGDSGRLAVVVIHKDAVQRSDLSAAFGTYDMFVRGKLDDRVEDEIRRGVREAIIEARVERSGLQRAVIEGLTTVRAPDSRTVTKKGESRTNEVANLLVPGGFMMLLLLSVLTGGQYLLMSTIEEKSNRVMEVLVAAVSPFELMTGKILGQMAVGLLVLAIYAVLGISALALFAAFGALDPWLIVFLLVFYLLAYLTIGALMAAIGSAVNDVREAQSLMMPIMLLTMLPWMLWVPILRDPNGALATTLSFIPPVGNFVMLLRLSSTAAPPMWQTLLSIVVSAVGVWAALWFAAKVFRVGILMSGKPPSFATLLRWARMG
ncbi:MAG: ABC transporter permease [Gammaproteobacteria bacterium]